MRRIFNFLLLFVFIALSYFSFATFQNLNTFQYLVSERNQHPVSQPESEAAQITNFQLLRDRLFWDADVGTALVSVVNNFALQSASIAEREQLLSKARDDVHQALSFRPRDMNLLITDMNLLIDQGAPAAFILPRLDKLISLVPKDQDLKAELSMICFKLLASERGFENKDEIMRRLRKLFVYNMDYRGITQIRQYAVIYGQQKILSELLAEIN